MTKFISIILLFTAVTALAQENSRYELAEINFNGNNVISSSRLSDVILSKETPWWFWKFLNSFTSLGSEPVYFDSSNIPIDVRALKSYYKANGFFEARVKYHYDVDTTDKEVTLTYTISEGQADNYGKVNLDGLSNVPDLTMNKFRDEVKFDSADRYIQNVVQQKIQSGVSVLLNNGFMFAQFDSTIVVTDTVEDRANMTMYFTTGKEYHIDTVKVTTSGDGAPYVKESMLRDISDIKSGELYNLDKLRQSQQRLFRTGLFNSIVLTGVEQDTTDSKVPIKLEANIGKLNELSPEIIVNNQQSALNAGLGLSYIRRNFLGSARKLTVSTSFGVQDIFNVDYGSLLKKFSFRDTTLLGYLDARITLEQPYLFSRPIFGTWENYATINKQPRYNNTVYGSKITFDFELPRYTAINFLSTYYNVEQSNEVYRTNNDSLSRKLLSIIGAEFGRTTTNDILFPTEGYIISILFEEANSLPYLIGKLGNDEFNGSLFYKVSLNADYYLAVNQRKMAVFATKFKVGRIQIYHGDYAGLPLNRTFYAGGSNSVRGWRSNELVPQNATTVYGINGVNVKGGTFLLEGSFEWRYKFVKTFGTAIFFDYGNTWIGYDKFRYDQLALSPGVGLRYYSSIAPFRLDFAFKLYNPDDKTWVFKKNFWNNIVFHFGIGEAF
jgi:outer membrane protein assembly complex protein YaeT